MDTFYYNNRGKVHQDIKEFHARNLYNRPNYEQNEFLELIVSMDGTYSHVGHNSSSGATFVCELFTGRVIDFEFTEKCFKCKDCDKYETNGTCIYGHFHGDSGKMEVHNALELFKRSEQFGFRYTTLVADGDNKVWLHVKNANIYVEGVVLQKFECSNHMQKRGHKTLLKFGDAYMGPDEESEGD